MGRKFSPSKGKPRQSKLSRSVTLISPSGRQVSQTVPIPQAPQAVPSAAGSLAVPSAPGLQAVPREEQRDGCPVCQRNAAPPPPPPRPVKRGCEQCQGTKKKKKCVIL